MRRSGNVAADAALRVDDGVVVDGEMARDADLSGEQDALAGDAAAGEAGLRTDNVVLADVAGVPDLDEAVDFRATADAGFADRGAVHGGERLDFDIVLNHGGAGLGDFVVGSLVGLGESVTVAADDDVVLKDDAMSDAAEFPDDGSGMGDEIIADLRAFVDDGVGMEDGAAAEADALANDGVGADGVSSSPISAVAATTAVG